MGVLMNKIMKKIHKSVFASTVLIIVTICIFMPCSLFLGNIDEFSVPFIKIIPIIGVASILVLLVIGVISICFIKKLSIYSAILYGTGIAVYIQGNFLNKQLPIMNGVEVEWSQFKTITVISSLIWVACIFVPLIMMYFKKVMVEKIIMWSSYFLSTIQIFTLVVLIITTQRTVKTEFILSKEKEFEVSSKENTIVFVVDTLDATWFEEYLDNNVEVKEKLKDFTYFNNAVAGGAPTILGMPAMLTGQVYDGNERIDEFYKKSYQSSSLFRDLKKANYDIRLYSEYSYINGINEKEIDNLETNQEHIISSKIEFAKYLYRLVGVYALPQSLKKYLWFYSDNLSGLVEAKDRSIEKYSFDDPQFYKEYKESGLLVADNKNKFILYHLFGAHGPYTMNENCEKVSESNTSKNRQIEGTFKIIFEYINELNKLGVYDNSTIMIVADHGGIEFYQNPAILVKQRGTQNNFEVSTAPITFRNLWATFASSGLKDHSKYEKDVFEVEDNEIVIRTHTADRVLVKPYFPDDLRVHGLPYVVMNISGNARNLESITLKEIDMINHIEGKIGDTINFVGKDKVADDITRNLSEAKEEKGRWTLGDNISFEILLSDYKKGNIVVDIEYGRTLGPIQNVDIFVGKNKIDSVECKNSKIDKHICINISESDINNGRFVIKLEFPDAARPCDFDSNSNDTRVLGIAIKKITFRKG